MPTITEEPQAPPATRPRTGAVGLDPTPLLTHIAGFTHGAAADQLGAIPGPTASSPSCCCRRPPMPDSPAHLVPEHPGNRVFKWMPELPSAYNGDTGTVRLVESSLAEGPHVAVRLKREADSWAGLPEVNQMIPLSAENAWRLREQIGWLLEHHYQGDARPPSETLRPSPDASDTDLIAALSAEVTRLTLAVDRHREVDRAAKRLLDNATPFVSALELDGPGVDGNELYADLAEALGLGEDYTPRGEG